MFRNFIVFLVMFVTIIGPSAVIGAIGYASIRALGRNPSAAPKILQAMIVALIFSESNDFLLGGNFHGQPVALAMDFLSMAVAELANISERRIERLVNQAL